MSISFLNHIFYQKNNNDIYFNGQNYGEVFHRGSSAEKSFATTRITDYMNNDLKKFNITCNDIVDLCTSTGCTFILTKSKKLYGMGKNIDNDGISLGGNSVFSNTNITSFILIDTDVIRMIPILTTGIVYFKSNGDVILSQNNNQGGNFLNTSSTSRQQINTFFSEEDLSNINNIKSARYNICVINNKDDGTCLLHLLGKCSIGYSTVFDATVETPKHVKKVDVGYGVDQGFVILYTDGTVAVSNGTSTSTSNIAYKIGVISKSPSSTFELYNVNISDVDDIWMHEYDSILFKMKDGTFNSIGYNDEYSLCAGISNTSAHYTSILPADSINTLGTNEGGIKEILSNSGQSFGYLILTNAGNIYIINDSTNTDYKFVGSANGKLLDTDVRSITKLSRPGYFITANNKGYYYDEENSKTVEFDLANKADVKDSLPSSLESINNIDKSILSGEFKINKIE